MKPSSRAKFGEQRYHRTHHPACHAAPACFDLPIQTPAGNRQRNHGPRSARGGGVPTVDRLAASPWRKHREGGGVRIAARRCRRRCCEHRDGGGCQRGHGPRSASSGAIPPSNSQHHTTYVGLEQHTHPEGGRRQRGRGRGPRSASNGSNPPSQIQSISQHLSVWGA